MSKSTTVRTACARERVGATRWPADRLTKAESDSTPRSRKPATPVRGIGLSRRSLRVLGDNLRIVLEHLALTFSESEPAWGRRVSLPVPFKRRPTEMEDCVYVFVEAKLPSAPKRPAIGFTEEDVVPVAEVHVYKKVGPRFCGEVFPLSALLCELADSGLRERLIERINEMMKMIWLDDEFLDALNLGLATGRCCLNKVQVH